jgi:cytochrome d ubiquinol oxidase subunit II
MNEMSEMAFWLPVVWAGVIAFAVIFYVLADGFDLGVGILFPAVRKEEHRDQMMNSVAPFWDANETWLVLGGGGLFLAFPRAYAIVGPALYMPLILMLLALIFRGVAFEFRFVAKPDHHKWDYAFWLGSTIATLSQGIVLGGLVQGIEVGPDGQYAGGAFDWLTPFSLLCGLALIAGYALLGAGWLMMKAEGEVVTMAQKAGRAALIAVLAFALLVSLWTPLEFGRIAERWFSFPNIFFLWPVPVVTALIGLLVWFGIARGSGVQTFTGAIALFVLCFLGLGISLFPNIVPPDTTIWETAASPESQIFSLIGTLIMIPIILAYTAFNYWLFSGRIGTDEGYH